MEVATVVFLLVLEALERFGIRKTFMLLFRLISMKLNAISMLEIQRYSRISEMEHSADQAEILAIESMPM